MSFIKSQIFAYIIYIVFVVGFVMLVNWFFKEKIDFNTTRYNNINILETADQIGRLSPNLTHIKIRKSLVHCVFILYYTNRSLLMKLKLHDGSQIDSKKIIRFFKDTNLDNINFLSSLTRYFFTFYVDTDGSFFLSEQEKQFINYNEQLVIQIAKYCSGYFETECLNFMTGNNIKTTSNTKISPIALFLARFSQLLNNNF